MEGGSACLLFLFFAFLVRSFVPESASSLSLSSPSLSFLVQLFPSLALLSFSSALGDFRFFVSSEDVKDDDVDAAVVVSGSSGGNLSVSPHTKHMAPDEDEDDNGGDDAAEEEVEEDDKEVDEADIVEAFCAAATHSAWRRAPQHHVSTSGSPLSRWWWRQ